MLFFYLFFYQPLPVKGLLCESETGKTFHVKDYIRFSSVILLIIMNAFKLITFAQQCFIHLNHPNAVNERRRKRKHIIFTFNYDFPYNNTAIPRIVHACNWLRQYSVLFETGLIKSQKRLFMCTNCLVFIYIF